MAKSREIRKSLNQNKSLIEAARLKKKEEIADQEIKKQVEHIKQYTTHRRALKYSGGNSNRGGLSHGGDLSSGVNEGS